MSPMNIFWAQLLLATDILKTMDQTANPCDNFYQFACGNYFSGAEIPPDKTEFSAFKEIASMIQQQLKKVLEKPLKQDDPKSTQLFKTYFQSCMNVQQLEKLALTPLKSLIDSLGGWPILLGDKWQGEADYDWIKMSAHAFRDHGHGSFFVLDKISESQNVTIRTLGIFESSLFLGERGYYLDKTKSEQLQAFRRYMLETVVQLGADGKTAEQDVDEVIALETALANIKEGGKRATDYDSVVTIGQLKREYSSLQMEKFFGYLTENGTKIDDSARIYVYCRAYLTRLTGILDKTKKRTLANYQIWTVVSGYITYLAPSLQHNYKKFREVTSGVTKDRLRWEECVSTGQMDLKEAVSSVYVKHYFGKEEQDQVTAMTADIKLSMKKLLEEVKWMDSSTRIAAQLKVENMVYSIGHPEYIFNDTRLLIDFEGIEFNVDQYFANAIAKSKTLFREKIRSVGELASRTDWEENTADGKSASYTQQNAMVFSAGILNYPFFASYAPNYVNYARIGSFIGHELTHGFDSNGRLGDSYGNAASWWNNSTLEFFHNGTKCFIDQYGNITDKLTGNKLDGQFLVAENIADNGAIKLAYQTYKRSLSSRPSPEPILHNLGNYSFDQIFFISYGQAFCNRIRREALQKKMTQDPHSPSQYRVNVPLGNYDVFADTFKCPPGSFMNPAKKCTIW